MVLSPSALPTFLLRLSVPTESVIPPQVSRSLVQLLFVASLTDVIEFESKGRGRNNNDGSLLNLLQELTRRSLQNSDGQAVLIAACKTHPNKIPLALTFVIMPTLV